MRFKPGQEPVIDIGLFLANEIQIVLHNNFYVAGKTVTGKLHVTLNKHLILLQSESCQYTGDKFLIEPGNDHASFTLIHTRIGIDFHWEQIEDLTYTGSIKLQLEKGNIRLINQVNLEDYLTSVISSEMNAKASLPLLKAHAIISRSWLIAQLDQTKRVVSAIHNNDYERIYWFDRQDHTGFDVCADDHCQRYQGLTRITHDKVLKAVSETRGIALIHQGKVCDARFSKCCGGITERFDTCWQNLDLRYLQPVLDDELNGGVGFKSEDSAQNWIRNKPEVYCNTCDERILTQVLNDYDLQTKDFFRWKVTVTAALVKRNLKEKLKYSVGEVLDLIPLNRGPSGRIFRLKIIGSQRELIIGKELIIRKILSDSHLFSSAFVVEKNKDQFEEIAFTLIGAGWGHGVGLCQIGAAVMGEKGFNHEHILNHYFKNTTLEAIY